MQQYHRFEPLYRPPAAVRSESIPPPPGLNPTGGGTPAALGRAPALRAHTSLPSGGTLGLAVPAKAQTPKLRASHREASVGPRGRAMIDLPENDVVITYEKSASHLSDPTQGRKSRSPRAKSSDPVRPRKPLTPPRTRASSSGRATDSPQDARAPLRAPVIRRQTDDRPAPPLRGSVRLADEANPQEAEPPLVLRQRLRTPSPRNGDSIKLFDILITYWERLNIKMK